MNDPGNKRKNSSITFQQGIDELLNTYKLKSKFEETSLLASWEKVMGKTISNRTTNLFINNRKLFIEISSAPLKKEMSLAKSKILELINRAFENPVVDEIIFL